MGFSESLQALLDHRSLSREQMRDAFAELMNGHIGQAQMAGFLVALRMKGETADEITGAAEAMRSAAVPVRCSAPVVVDTCGTGGDGRGSFNVSTAAAFVVAGAGFTVAKHGNRSVSSQAGSADILEALGIPIDHDASLIEKCLSSVGIAFLWAVRMHPAMKHAMAVRKELGVRTIFNVLGPLTNPARPAAQLVGVFEAAWVKPLADALVHLGCREGFVVHGDGHDEIALSGPTEVVEIRAGRTRSLVWKPEDFGLEKRPEHSWKGGDAKHNAEILRRVLNGEHGGYRDIVCVNAAAAILAAARAKDPKCSLDLAGALRMAQESIDGKSAVQKLESLKEFFQRIKHHG